MLVLYSQTLQLHDNHCQLPFLHAQLFYQYLMSNFDFTSPYQTIVQRQGIGNTLETGPSYGILRHVMYGATINDAVMANELYKEYQSFSSSLIDEKSLSKFLTSSPNIEFIVHPVFGDDKNQSLLKTILFNSGWQMLHYDESNDTKYRVELFSRSGRNTVK